MTENRRFPAFRGNFGRILAVWGVVTGISIAMVLNAVLPWTSSGSWPVHAAYQYAIGPGLLVIVGVYVGRRANHPGIVAIGTVVLLWAALSATPTLACLGRACPQPEDYEHWQNINLALDIGLGGPRLLISTRTGACAFQCPYKIQLVPLGIGYGSLAFGLISES